jgi:hypothetical protein
MKGRPRIQETELDNNQRISLSGMEESSSADFIKINRIPEILASEGNENFRNYIEWLGLSRDPKLVVLSSIHHYYYDAEEMTGVGTVVNLKELNHLKDINTFLNSMFLILPPKCYLIGCFVDYKKQNVFSLRKRSIGSMEAGMSEAEKNGIVSRIPFFNTIFKILDAKANKYLSRRLVSQLLTNNGFEIMDMTELEGLTYFCSRNQRSANN